MGIRSAIASALVKNGRKLGRNAGLEMAVKLSDHSVKVEMVNPDDESYAWDPSLYRYGNVFIEGYANPIKPTVSHYTDLEEPDEVILEETEQEPAGGVSVDDDGRHVKLISSSRYGEYMRQDLISQLLNPREQWKLIAYAVIALAMLMLINVFVSLSAAGVI